MCHKNTIIVGDFNINLLKESKQKEDFLSLLKCYNFTVKINDITFVRGDRTSCIDNIITNVLEDNMVNELEHNNIGDGHAAIFCGILSKHLRKSRAKVQ